MTQLCLIRHGQTDWNIQGRYQGQSNVPLNEPGRIQAHELAIQLQAHPFAAIYSSDLARAQETADIIGAAVQVTIQIDVRLREINQGAWEGQHVDVIKTRFAELWQQRIADPASVRPPGGETVSEVAQRMYSALDEIAGLYPNGSVLIVSHGLSLATVLCKAEGIPVGRAYDVIPENAVPVWVVWH
jgi:probable phosphoglycerate mutase